MAIVGELSRIVQDHNLLEVSETEQLMTTQASHSEVQQKVHTVFFFQHLVVKLIEMKFSFQFA